MMELFHYQKNDGHAPFASWMSALDPWTRARIAQHIDRMKLGNMGDSKHLQGGVFEKKIDFGPGYRLYYSKEGNKIIVLLCGGDKSTQGRDIDRALEYLHDHVERTPK